MGPATTSGTRLSLCNRSDSKWCRIAAQRADGWRQAGAMPAAREQCARVTLLQRQCRAAADHLNAVSQIFKVREISIDDCSARVVQWLSQKPYLVRRKVSRLTPWRRRADTTCEAASRGHRRTPRGEMAPQV